MIKKYKVLVIEDDKNIQNVIRLFLENDGHTISVASNGSMGLELYNKEKFDIILLDIMLPIINGWDFCEIIREKSDIPIIMLTARDKEYDKLKGFELGVDDYITKPFSLKELLARMTAVIKRYRKNDVSKDSTIELGDIIINTTSREVRIDNKPIPLTPKEYELLYFFSRNMNQVFSREQILSKLWNNEDVTDYRTVDTHVKQLRNKMKNYKKYIQTVWGIGYKFHIKDDEQ